MASRTTLFLSGFVGLLVQTAVLAQPNYFRFDDCSKTCVSLNVSCTIQESSDDFVSECYKLSSSCAQIASNTIVCLRPNLPPLGGEQIWLAFRDKCYPNKPDIVVDNYVLHCVLVAAGALVALAVFLSVTVLYMMSTASQGYTRYANPSPTQVDGPYMPTVELGSPA